MHSTRAYVPPSEIMHVDESGQRECKPHGRYGSEYQDVPSTHAPTYALHYWHSLLRFIFDMFVLTSTLFAIFCLSLHVAATAEPCPECEQGMVMPPPIIVTKTAPCCECGECEHQPTTSALLTSTTSVCKASSQSSMIPYTSGSSTFYIASCTPSTLWYTPSPSTVWYTQNASTATCAPQTSVTTVIEYRNATAQTMMATSLQAYTSNMYFTSDILTTLPGATATGSTTIYSTTTQLTTGG